jgi:hypothetical protein
MGGLTDEQKQIIRQTLVILAEERVRVRTMIDEKIVDTIKLSEIDRKLTDGYNDLRRLLTEP